MWDNRNLSLKCVRFVSQSEYNVIGKLFNKQMHFLYAFALVISSVTIKKIHGKN